MVTHDVFSDHTHNAAPTRTVGRWPGQMARAYDFAALNLTGLCEAIPYSREVREAGLLPQSWIIAHRHLFGGYRGSKDCG